MTTKQTVTLETVHTPTGEEYGITPTQAGNKAKVRVLCQPSQPGGVPVWGDMPKELPKVCPNMGTLAMAHVTPHGKGEADFLVFEGTKMDLAAWKAVRTKRHTNRADQGSYQLDPRSAAEPVDPTLSEAAQRAWVTRRAAQSEATQPEAK